MPLNQPTDQPLPHLIIFPGSCFRLRENLFGGYVSQSRQARIQRRHLNAGALSPFQLHSSAFTACQYDFLMRSVDIGATRRPILNGWFQLGHRFDEDNQALTIYLVMQCIASDPETRRPFLKAQLPLWVFPLIDTKEESEVYEYMRSAGLALLGRLCQVSSFFLCIYQVLRHYAC